MGCCVTCAEVLIRQDTIHRLTKSGAMATMRRELEGCSDAGRERAEVCGLEGEGHRLARALLIGLARGER